MYRKGGIVMKVNGNGQVMLAGILWGTIGIFIWYMEKAGASVEWISFLRVFFSWLILVAFVGWRNGWASMKVTPKIMVYCALLGLICHGIYNIFYSLAVTSIGVSLSAVLLNVATVFTAVFSALFFQEQITPLKGLALAINIVGCILAVTGGTFDLSVLSLWGLGCGIMAGLCYGLTAIIGKVAGYGTDAFVMSLWSFFWAALCLLGWILWQGGPMVMTPSVLGMGFFYALIPTVLGYILYYLGLQQIDDLSKVPVLASLETAAAVILGMSLTGDILNLINFLGIALIIASQWLIGKSRR